ncbi:hypothetical protein ACLMJK_002480 [Lecanora helva]
MADATTSSSLPLAPPPWTCKATAYVLNFYNSSSSGLPRDIVYDALEAEAPEFSSDNEGELYKGGLCMAQIIRYGETPVGAYDELAILPGYFKRVRSTGKAKQDLRVTGIWVSQEATLLNGRKNWNIPKHLARFIFTPMGTTSQTLQVQVFSTKPSSSRPFFSATISPVPYTPSFPFNSSWLDYIGFSTHILQPPLPSGIPADVVVRSDKWLRSHPILKSGKAKLVWFDMKQVAQGKKGAGSGNNEEEHLLNKDENVNWWPGMRRWHLGIHCSDAILELGEPDIL